MATKRKRDKKCSKCPHCGMTLTDKPKMHPEIVSLIEYMFERTKNVNVIPSWMKNNPTKD